MNGEVLLGIDVGTSSVRACLFSASGRLLGSGRTPCAVERPRPGWAEVDPRQWWHGFLQAFGKALSSTGVAPTQVRGVGLSTLFPTLIPFGADGTPLANAILYCDQRSVAQVAAIRAAGHDRILESRTTNRVAPGTFALTSLMWLRDELPEVYGRACWYGTVNTMFSMQLAGVPSMDYSSGLLFGLCDAGDQSHWCAELADLVGIDARKLPPLFAPGAAVGTVTSRASQLTGIEAGVPVAAGAGDAAAATFGGGRITPGDLFYVTGSSDCLSFVIDRPQTSLLFPNPGYLDVDTWLSVGTSTSTGAAIDWFAREFLGADSGAAVADEAANAPVGANGVTFLPYLQGERTPIWDPMARGTFHGLSLSTGRAHMARAVLEGTAFALRQIVEAAETEGGATVGELPTAGGGARNELWNRIKADVTGRPLQIFEFQEFSALGAAMLAGTACGIYRSHRDAVSETSSVRAARTIEPDPTASDAYGAAFEQFRELYPALAPLGARHQSPAPRQ